LLAHVARDPPTTLFADRFFFETVQRRAYDGYGAVDAAARVAAQEQNAETRS
jgi:4-hydroxyphenylpyruvate dioxygenase